MLTLEVLIATCRPDGIARVASMELPRLEGVSYLVSWQQPGGAKVPEALGVRPDVRVVTNEATCLSGNRNAAFEAARGEILLIADDDLHYTPGWLRGVVDAFASRPSMKLALFRNESSGKEFPSVEIQLGRRLPKGYYVSSVEIALRRECLEDTRLRFPLEFGLGAHYGCGEEELFLATAIRFGLEVRFIPQTVCRHEGETTGSGALVSLATAKGFGATIALLAPFTFSLRIPLKAWRLAKAGKIGFFPALTAMGSGAISALINVTPPWRRKE